MHTAGELQRDRCRSWNIGVTRETTHGPGNQALTGLGPFHCRDLAARLTVAGGSNSYQNVRFYAGQSNWEPMLE